MTMLEAAADLVEPEQQGRPWWRNPWPMAGLALALLAVLAVMAFVIFEPIQVLPRIRLAPGFSLTDHTGARLTSEDMRGEVVVYTFTYDNCAEPCDSPEGTMAELSKRIGEVDMGDTAVRFVTISFDPDRDDTAALADRARRFGADGVEWKYAAPQPDQVRNVVGAGFKTWFEEREDGSFSFDPALILVDGWGIVRGEYRYQTLAADGDRILRHIGILGEELRNSHGANSFAYEAAHFFLCYP
ncbi:MAG: SCO family protein [Acidimicrobiia bacterium]|nr:SCO family protein [Acidimicrobiia bacterium]